MDCLHCLFPFTVIIDKTFCDYFMYESMELLKHMIFYMKMDTLIVLFIV